MIPVTSHIKPTWQGQADLAGHPGQSHTAEQCVLQPHRPALMGLGTIFRLLPWLPLKKKKKILQVSLPQIREAMVLTLSYYKLQIGSLVKKKMRLLFNPLGKGFALRFTVLKVVILCLEHREPVINFFLLL